MRYTVDENPIEISVVLMNVCVTTYRTCVVTYTVISVT